MNSRPFLIEQLFTEAVATATGSSIKTARFRDFSFGYSLSDSISSGSISVSLQFWDGVAWQTFYTFTVDTNGDGSSMPVVMSRKAFDRVRGVITAHDAVNSDTTAVGITLTITAGE